MFLTKEELQTLTGYKMHKKQIEFLEREKIAFTVARSGMPIVSKENLENRLSDKPRKKMTGRTEPDLESFRKYTQR